MVDIIGKRKREPVTPERIESFMVELADLTNKYGLEVGGCGDCGSAWVADVGPPGHIHRTNIVYDETKNRYA